MEVKSKETHPEDYQRELILKKYKHILCYYDKDNGKVASLNLWHNGIQIFNRATCIKDFDSLRKIEFRSKTPDVNQMLPFVQEQIIDYTRIVTCFENFVKGCLILNGYVVHYLNKTKHGNLAKQQRMRPIAIPEVFQASSFIHLNVKEQNNDLEIESRTVNFSWLLKPEYQKELKLPRDVVEALVILNDERNRLHFITELEFELSQPMLNRIESLRNFVYDIMIPRMIDMDNYQKTHPRSTPA
jgi:hypothetical protein